MHTDKHIHVNEYIHTCGKTLIYKIINQFLKIFLKKILAGDEVEIGPMGTGGKCLSGTVKTL